MNEWAKEIHGLAEIKGWWESERAFPEIVALCHSELSEALEEYRTGRPGVYYMCDGRPCHRFQCEGCEYEGQRNDKPEGVAVEMIDCLIRILDWCGQKKLDVDGLVRLKHEYNKTRPYKHGGKRI